MIMIATWHSLSPEIRQLGLFVQTQRIKIFKKLWKANLTALEHFIGTHFIDGHFGDKYIS